MKINNEKYSKLVEAVEIKQILIKNLEINDVKFPKIEGSKYEVKLDYKCESFERGLDSIEFYPNFNIRIEYESDIMVEIRFKLRAIYGIESISEYEDEYILKFMDLNVPVNIWPYAREVISSMTTRIGYPSLVISPYRV